MPMLGAPPNPMVAAGTVKIVKDPCCTPRLMIDNTVCGTNASCFVPEEFWHVFKVHRRPGSVVRTMAGLLVRLGREGCS